jgi:hypothetical protein
MTAIILNPLELARLGHPGLKGFRQDLKMRKEVVFVLEDNAYAKTAIKFVIVLNDSSSCFYMYACPP